MATRTRGFWKGNITFGLVNIPVTVVSAENARRTIDFDLLERTSKAHVGYQKINKRTGKPVRNEDVVRGLKLEGGDYVLFDDKELARLRVRGSDEIEIRQFIDKTEVDPFYFEKPYYLVPSKGGEKTYVLLRETLRRMGKYAVGAIVLHQKRHIAVIGAQGPALTLEVVRYAQDLKQPHELDLPAEGTRDVRISPKELSMAERLVEELSGTWNPHEFKDTYFDELMEAVRKKSKLRAVDAEPEPKEAPAEKVLDLMPLLERSLRDKKVAKRRIGK